MNVAVLLLLALNTLQVQCWHDPSGDDGDFHCWPLAKEVDPFHDCPVTLEWVEEPPHVMKAEESFNVTYRLIMEDDFYQWAMEGAVNAFTHIPSINSSTTARQWCEDTVCPVSKSSVTRKNCCIHHVNVHSCPITESVSYCGPWIPPNGTIYTHSSVLWGSASQVNWTSHVGGLYVPGLVQVIAHFKIGNIQIAKYFDIEVTPKTVCGDGLCEYDDGESCSTCPSDCGRCPLPVFAWAIIGIVAFSIVLTIAIIVLVFYRKNQALLWDNSWIMDYDDIKEDSKARGFMGSAISVQTTNSLTSNKLASGAASKQIFTATALVNGKVYAMKKVPKRAFQLSKAVRFEVKKIRVLESGHLSKFFGACIDPENFCILTEYCPKGSLNDILLNEDVPLNWGFRFSFASDIARGMQQLHVSNIFHGRLKTQNCIVDDRWTVKVTDYGLPTLRDRHQEMADEDSKAEEDNKSLKMLVYKAPETYNDNYQPSPEADVYSFGVILVEIASRNDPYEDEFVEDLGPGWKPLLPTLVDQESQDNSCPCPSEYVTLIQDCWKDSPGLRPSFEQIRKVIQKINPNKASPIDMMMSMMEKYSKHLESIVSDRTADLMLEKQKTDRLLYSMLPRPVADKLRQGRIVDAENYAQCTIYFSDIVGFTNLSGSSTPFEVVELLNKLYICFDSIIDNYDVYKVETIGDAYMVVSGVPTANGERHAYEVANMACDLVAASETFIIPHKPKEPLKIRCGMHSGSVCAGVVGLKMPRYCLFGDTVNTASRMESNGEAYKIHVSDPAYQILLATNSFEFNCRGTIPVKGKGDMTTWWLSKRVRPYEPGTPKSEPGIIEVKAVSEIKLNGQVENGASEKSEKVKKISCVSKADSGFNDVLSHLPDIDSVP